MSFLANEGVSDKPYCVYRLRNISKKEIYHGITVDFEARRKEHSDGKVAATSYWNFAEDDIKYKIMAEDLPESEASELAHYLERNPDDQFSDYEYIETAGL